MQHLYCLVRALDKPFYFILSSEICAYLKYIKVVILKVKEFDMFYKHFHYSFRNTSVVLLPEQMQTATSFISKFSVSEQNDQVCLFIFLSR